MLVRQKRNSEQDLIIIKAHTSPIEKKVKYYSKGFHEHYGQHNHDGTDDCQFTVKHTNS